MSKKSAASVVDKAGPKPLNEHQVAAAERAHKWVDENWDKQKSLPGLEPIAKAAGLSPFHFHRIYRQHFGWTPKDRLTELQVERAKELMLKGKSLEAVALECRFSHQSHFTVRFKQRTGMTPRQWLRREQASQRVLT